MAETNNHGDITITNIWGYTLLASKDQVERNYYYLQNAHTDVIGIVGQDGKVKNTYSYDAFGNIVNSSQQVSNRYTYASEQYDVISGHYYLRARYYDPKVGRFMQEDSYRGDGLNLYAYVANNPVNFIDPTGYCGEKSSGDKVLSVDDYANLAQDIISSADGRAYTYTPRDWENEFTNNITPMLDMIPTDLADSQRQPLVDAIIMSEIYKLQGKYRTAYNASNNVISKYITERGFHQTLEPLFTQYPTKDKPTNGLLKAFLEGVSSGVKAGIIQGAMDWGATFNKGTVASSVTNQLDDVWDMPAGGKLINGRKYSQHALERMAPNTIEVKATLEARAVAKATEKGLQSGTKAFSDFVKKYVDPRNIPPSVIEDAIQNTRAVVGKYADTFIHETIDVKVIVNKLGDVITVIPK